MGVVAFQELGGLQAVAPSTLNCGAVGECAGGRDGAIDTIGVKSEEDQVVASGELNRCRKGQLLVAPPLPSPVTVTVVSPA